MRGSPGISARIVGNPGDTNNTESCLLPRMSQKPFSRTVQDLGNGSVGVTIPKELADEYGVGPGDELPVEARLEDGEVAYHLTDD